MASSTSLGQLITTEWIDGNSIKRSQPTASGGDIVNLDFVEELYGTLLSVFAQVCQTYSKTIPLSKQRQSKEALGRLHLWGRDFQDGKLACVLAQSDDLRNNVIELLGQVGKVILDLVDLDGCDNEFAELVWGLKTLIARSRIIITASNSSNSDSDDDFVSERRFGTKRGDKLGETSNARQKSNSGSVEGKGDLKPRLEPRAIEQSDKDLESKTRRRPSTLQRDRPRIYTPESSEDEDEDAGSDYGTLLECSIDCLMDLIPTMEQSLAHLQFGGIKTEISSRVPFSVSELALPWVQNVSDKFTSADNTLVERLGEANWQRYMTLRARTEQKHQYLDINEVVANNIPAAQIFQRAPQSIFKPLSLFHDSGLGSSVPTLPRYAVSAASHTSFISSVADDSAFALRVPPTPGEVDSGDPFKCEICGHLLSNIKNRVDWKIHVFADLQPYICTFDSCAKDLVTFPTRSLWGSHEFDEHRVTRSWKCPECAYADSTAQKLEEHLRRCHGEAVTLAQLPLIISAAETRRPLPIEDQECPLCRFIPGKSQRNFVKHVGRHMESVALAVLPRDAAEDSDQNSDSSIASQDDVLDSPAVTDKSEDDYFYVPLDFRLHTNLKGRDQELCLLDEGLFSVKREYGTASVLLYGHTVSSKFRLVQHYINLNRSKFPGGIFWINSRSNEDIDASLLSIARKYIWRTYKSGISTDLLLGIVTAWFAGRSDWLIVLNHQLSWLGLTEEVIQRRWPTPNSRHSSLIYISGPYNDITSSALPLDPIPLEIKPFHSTQPQEPEQNEESNIIFAPFGAGVDFDPLDTISTEAGTDTINLKMQRDNNPVHDESEPIPDVYQHELYSPTAVRGLADSQSRTTETQARPISPRSRILRERLETAHRSHLSQPDLAPTSRERSLFVEGSNYNLGFLHEPLTVSPGEVMLDYSDKDDGPRSDYKPQVYSPMIDENDKEDRPISNYVLVPEGYDASWLRTKFNSAKAGYDYRQYGSRPDHESQAYSPVGAKSRLTYIPDDQYTPSGSTEQFRESYGQSSENTPHEMSGQSTLSGFGLSNNDTLSDVPLFDVSKSGLLMQSLLCEYPGCSVTSKSISEYTNEDTAAAARVPLLLQQPVMIPTQVPQPKLMRQNLGVDLFHKIPSHTTDAISPSGTEYIPRLYDEAGDKKIASDGSLLGSREYRPRAFLVVGKGDTLFMLADECARLLGYRDSYMLFHKNRCLYKIILGQAEKDDLIHQEILPYSHRSRQIAVVTEKSMFRQFGSRIIRNGRRVRDDYWEESARAQDFSEDDMAGPQKPGGHPLTEQVVKDALLPPTRLVQINGDVHQPRTTILQDLQRQLMLLEQENEHRWRLATAPLQHDHLSSMRENYNSIPAPDVENQKTHQQIQDKAPHQGPQYKCPYCSTVFSQPDNLKNHLLTHSNKKQISCQTCDKRFIRLDELKRHEKLHTRSYICSVCKCRFALQDTLARHTQGPGGCINRKPTANSREGSDVDLKGNEHMRTPEPNGPFESEYAEIRDGDPTGALGGINIDQPRSKSLALSTASHLDASPTISHDSSSIYYDVPGSVIPSGNEGPTIVEYYNDCVLPTEALESKSSSVRVHHGPWKCDKPECVLLADFTHEGGLRRHNREYHMEDAEVRWSEEMMALEGEMMDMEREIMDLMTTSEKLMALGTIAVLNEKITALKETTALRGEITALSGKATALENTTAMKGEITALRGEMTALKGKMTALATTTARECMTALEGEMTALEKKTALEREMAALKEEVTAMHKVMTTLAENITALKDMTALNNITVLESTTALEREIRMLNENITAIHGKITALEEKSALTKITAPLDSIQSLKSEIKAMYEEMKTMYESMLALPKMTALEKTTALETNNLKTTAPIAAPPNPESPDKGDIIRCVCGQEEYPGLGMSARNAFESATYHNRTSTSFFAVDPQHLGSLLIQCDDCKFWQHGNCVGVQNAASCPDQYFCEQCRPQYHLIKKASSAALKSSVYLPNSITCRSGIDRMLPKPEDNPIIPSNVKKM
ncbi:hypothetical protein MMC17_002659 [Xylographa soralifera]|nr:hypothetical protein [Xylographa soralifera]